MLHPIFHCADHASNLGRLDYASLSQQTLMEMVIDRLEEPGRVSDSTDASNDLIHWWGLDFNDTGEVVEICWPQYGLYGSLALQWLPSTVRKCAVYENDLTGTVDMTRLPESLVSISVATNAFHGSFDLRSLPDGMQSIYAGYNNFSGSVHLDRLPDGLQLLYLDSNAFEGTICLTHLPSAIIRIHLSENKLCGSLNLTCLPSKLVGIYLNINNFSEEYYEYSEEYYDCPECDRPLKDKQTIERHLVVVHGYSDGDAKAQMKNAPASETQFYPQGHMWTCKYCEKFESSKVATVNHHVNTTKACKQKAIVRTALPPRTPPPRPQAVRELHTCPVEKCDFTSKALGWITRHLLSEHGIERKVERKHRPRLCMERIRHLLLDCPTLAHLRLKYNVPPVIDADFWFSPRPALFLLDALRMLPSFGFKCPQLPHIPSEIIRLHAPRIMTETYSRFSRNDFNPPRKIRKMSPAPQISATAEVLVHASSKPKASTKRQATNPVEKRDAIDESQSTAAAAETVPVRRSRKHSNDQ